MKASSDTSFMAKQEDPFFELGLLAANLQEEVSSLGTRISVDHHDGALVVAYHDIVVLYWTLLDDQYVCHPTSRRTYTATNPRRVREMTIRLVFEFVRGLQHKT